MVDTRLTLATGTAGRQAVLEMVADRPGNHRITLGADKAYDVTEFVADLRKHNVTPHVAQNTTNRRSAIGDRQSTVGGSLACSADMMLEALVACAGVTVSAIATAMGVKLRGGRVIAEGQWDARGTLGVDREAPVGLSDIALTFELDTDADAATMQRLVEMSERFCPETRPGWPSLSGGSRSVGDVEATLRSLLPRLHRISTAASCRRRRTACVTGIHYWRRWKPPRARRCVRRW